MSKKKKPGKLVKGKAIQTVDIEITDGALIKHEPSGSTGSTGSTGPTFRSNGPTGPSWRDFDDLATAETDWLVPEYPSLRKIFTFGHQVADLNFGTVTATTPPTTPKETEKDHDDTDQDV